MAHGDRRQHLHGHVASSIPEHPDGRPRIRARNSRSVSSETTRLRSWCSPRSTENWCTGRLTACRLATVTCLPCARAPAGPTSRSRIMRASRSERSKHCCGALARRSSASLPSSPSRRKPWRASSSPPVRSSAEPSSGPPTAVPPCITTAAARAGPPVGSATQWRALRSPVRPWLQHSSRHTRSRAGRVAQLRRPAPRWPLHPSSWGRTGFTEARTAVVPAVPNSLLAARVEDRTVTRAPEQRAGFRGAEVQGAVGPGPAVGGPVPAVSPHCSVPQEPLVAPGWSGD